jgi:hypothetical protein
MELWLLVSPAIPCAYQRGATNCAYRLVVSRGVSVSAGVGGKVQVISHPGAGTRVSGELPLREPVAAVR